MPAGLRSASPARSLRPGRSEPGVAKQAPGDPRSVSIALPADGLADRSSASLRPDRLGYRK